jgi:hypothetical protein
MSGLRADGEFELTYTKAHYWHRKCWDCPGSDLDHVWRDHLEPLGWTRRPTRSSGYLHLIPRAGCLDVAGDVWRAVSACVDSGESD